MRVPVLGIIQARMSSSRCPGKVLREVQGQPLLSFLVERLLRSNELDGLVVATSALPADDAIAAFCDRQDLHCYRGELEDVAGRFAGLLKKTNAPAFLRVSADSPVMDPALVDRAIRLFREEGPEIVTNVQRRTFPKGESVEVLDTAAFLRGYAAMTSAADKEHVTSYFYKQPGFKIRNFESEDGLDYSQVRLCVDTEEEFSAFQTVADKWPAEIEFLGWRDMVRLYEKAGGQAVAAP